MLKSFKEIIASVRENRNKARADSKKAYPGGVLSSRGAYVAVTVIQPDGKEFDAFPGYDREWRGTREDLEKAREEALERAKGGKIKYVSVFGGYDWRESRDDEDYLPDIDTGQWATDNLEDNLFLLGEIQNDANNEHAPAI